MQVLKGVEVRFCEMMMRLSWCCLLLGLAGCRDKAPPRAVAVRDDGALVLTLASINVRYESSEDRGWRAWPNRIDRVVHVLRGIGPDVFGIQEALHGQAADLRASLPDFDFHGVGRDDGKREGEYAAIFWRKDRFEADPMERGRFWLSDTPEVVGSKSWGNEIVRIAVWVRLRDRASGRSFYVFNTHWDHRSQASREHAALLIAARIDGRAHPGDPVVLMGDFNATEGNPAVDYFLGERVALAGRPAGPWSGALLNPYQQLHPGVRNRRTLHFWRGHQDGWAKVDHILVSRGAIAEAAGIHHAATRESQPSDHFPVWARVRWP